MEKTRGGEGNSQEFNYLKLNPNLSLGVAEIEIKMIDSEVENMKKREMEEGTK